jgi:hypothetical protein
MATGSNPALVKGLPRLKAFEFLISKRGFDRLLQAHHINLLLPDIVFELGTMATPTEAPDVPA